VNRGSLERRLLARLVLVVGSALGVAGLVLVGIVEVRVRADFDRLLGGQARALASLSEQEEGQLWLEFDAMAYPEFLPGPAAEYFEFRDESGRTISSSASLAGGGLRVAPLEPGTREPVFLDLRLPDGRPGRAVVLRFDPRVEFPDEEEGPPETADPAAQAAAAAPPPGGGAPATSREGEIVVARGRGSLDVFLLRVRSSVLIAFAVLLLGIVLLIGWTLRRELLRVRELAERLRAIDAASLGRPLAKVPLPSELQPVALRIEELLRRLHESFEREREFSRHLAHELRTPLAEMRAAIDVAVRWPESRDGLLETLKEVGSVGAQMERLLSSVLVLARAEAGIEALRPEELRLREELGRVLGDFSGRLATRGISVRDEVPSDASVLVPGAVLSLILRNLVANAADHADPSTWLAISYDPSRGALTFRNPASKLTPEDLPRIFERFWRKRADRSLGEHVGLGLALVRELAHGVGGEATASLERGVLSITVGGLGGPNDAAPPAHPLRG